MDMGYLNKAIEYDQDYGGQASCAYCHIWGVDCAGRLFSDPRGYICDYCLQEKQEKKENV